MPCITNARKVEVDCGTIKVERETDVGYQTVSAPLPALLTTALTFGEPRCASLKGIMGAKKKTITALTLADLALEYGVGSADRRPSCRASRPRRREARARRSRLPTERPARARSLIFFQEKKLV